jgi:hypothetical protein
VGELLSAPERFDGVEVRLSGVQVTVLQTCTEQSCGSGNPCCNRCSAGAYIGVEPQYLALSRADGSAYAASGTNCKLDGTIEVGAGPYSMVGRLEVKAYGPTFRTKSIVAEPSTGSP